MKKLLLTLFIFSNFIFCSKDDNPSPPHNKTGILKNVIDKMETKSKPDYLSEYEWDVLLYINYARLFPKEFTNNEIIPFSDSAYSDKTSSNYIDYVKPAIDRMLGIPNPKNNIVDKIDENISLLGKVSPIEPSLAFTLGERDFLSDPTRNGHHTDLGGWGEYAKKYLIENPDSPFVGQGFILGGGGEIAWPQLPENYSAKVAVIEWIIDRGNIPTQYGHREMLLTFNNGGGKILAGIAIHKAPDNIINTIYKGWLALHVGFGMLNYHYDVDGKFYLLSTEKEGLNKDSKNPNLAFPVFRTPAK